MVGYWSIGDKKSYHLTRTETVFKNDKKKAEETTTVEFDLQISVLDSTDSSYHMRMTYKNRKKESDKKSKAFTANPLENYSIEYMTDEYGVFDSITNLKELAELVKTQFSKTMDAMEGDDSTKLMIAQVAEKMFNNTDILKLFFQEEILLLHSIYGVQLKIETPVDFELEYPPLNDVKMLGEGTATLKMIDKERDYCSVYMVQRPYDEEIEAFLTELIVQSMPVNLEKVDLSECSFDAVSKLSYSMELTSGWMKKVTNKATVTTVVKNKKSKVLISTVLEEK